MKEKLEQLLETIKQAEKSPENEELFRMAVSQTLAAGVITIVEGCRGFRVSRPTLERWRLGLSAPHPIGRPSVMRWLEEKTEEKLKS